MGTTKYTEDLYQRLKLLGVEASISMLKDHSFIEILPNLWRISLGAFLNPSDMNPWWPWYIVGTIKLYGSEIDAVNVICWSQYGWGIYSYGIEFLVISANLVDADRMKRTAMTIKWDSFFGNKAVDVKWKGDINIASKLNSDSVLRAKLLKPGVRFMGYHDYYIEICPEPKSGYLRIETFYFLPTAEQFDVLETIARIIKSG